MTGNNQDKGKGRASKYEASPDNINTSTPGDSRTISSPSASNLSSGVAALAAYSGITSGLDRELSGLSMSAGKSGSSSRLSKADGLLSEMIPRRGGLRHEALKSQSYSSGDSLGMAGVGLHSGDLQEQLFLRPSKGNWWQEYLHRPTAVRGDLLDEVPSPHISYEAPLEDGGMVCALLSDPTFSPMDDTSFPPYSSMDDSVKYPVLPSKSSDILPPSIFTKLEPFRLSNILPEGHPAREEIVSKIMLWEMENWDDTWKNYTDRVWGYEDVATIEKAMASRRKEKGKEPAKGMLQGEGSAGQIALERLKMMSGHIK